MENNCTLRPLTKSRNSKASISFSQPTAPIHRAVMAPMPAVSFDLLLTTWHLQNIPITPTYFDFFCNHTIDFKSKNPISNLWRNKLINNTTMIFFNFYSTISCFFYTKSKFPGHLNVARHFHPWNSLQSIRLFFFFFFFFDSSPRWYRHVTVTATESSPFRHRPRWINQHHQLLFRVSHVDWNTCRMAALAVTFSGKGACEWRCSPSYVTISMAGSSTARSTCFLAGQPLTLLHL